MKISSRFPPLQAHGFHGKSGSVLLLPGDVRETLAALPDDSIHCIVTSPPYYNLRDYQTGVWVGGRDDCDHVVGKRRRAPGENARYNAPEMLNLTAQVECPKCGALRLDKQIGLEQSVDAYVAALVGVFRQLWRVLRPDGVAWLNIGDSYAHGGGGPQLGRKLDVPIRSGEKGLKPKDKCLVPFRMALALQADGWYVRQDVIWHKDSPIPESVDDRPTCAHEYIFQLAKSARYFFDIEAVDQIMSWRESIKPGNQGLGSGVMGHSEGLLAGKRTQETRQYTTLKGANRRDVWTLSTESYAEEHPATFPLILPYLCLMAGSSQHGCCRQCGTPWQRNVQVHSRPATEDEELRAARHRKGLSHAEGSLANKVRDRTEHGWSPGCRCEAAGEPVPCVVLDPFGGHGTTGVAAATAGRNAVLCELNPAYLAAISRRLQSHNIRETDIGTVLGTDPSKPRTRRRTSQEARHASPPG